MSTKVTIILPVYNVEPYLRHCLDSVVNQTMRDIQIICVNDGSTDGSRAILQEYAEQDSRIEIIDQENQGGGSARNAAYPYIRGKYTYFADPDDWLELDLCQQCVEKAEATEADFVTLRHVEYNPDPQCSRPFDHTLPEIRQSLEEKYEIFQYLATWKNFWRSDFLLSNNIRFSEGKRPYNDVLPSWKGTVLADRIAILDNPLYHYRRIRLGSYQQATNEKQLVIVETFADIENMLHEAGLHIAYREIFIANKLENLHYRYGLLPAYLKPKFLHCVRQHWTKADREFCRDILPSHPDKNLRAFYLSQGFGGQLGMQMYHAELIKEFNTEQSCLLSEIARLQSEILRTQSEMVRTQSEMLRLQKEGNKNTRFHYNKYRLLSNLTWGKLREKYLAKKRAIKNALGIE